MRSVNPHSCDQKKSVRGKRTEAATLWMPLLILSKFVALVMLVVLFCFFSLLQLHVRSLGGRRGRKKRKRKKWNDGFHIQKHRNIVFLSFTHKCLQQCRERMTREGLSSLIVGIVPVDSLNTMPSQNQKKMKYVKERIWKPRESLCKYWNEKQIRWECSCVRNSTPHKEHKIN